MQTRFENPQSSGQLQSLRQYPTSPAPRPAGISRHAPPKPSGVVSLQSTGTPIVQRCEQIESVEPLRGTHSPLQKASVDVAASHVIPSDTSTSAGAFTHVPERTLQTRAGPSAFVAQSAFDAQSGRQNPSLPEPDDRGVQATFGTS
jgi:hypothetical protein